MQPLQPKKMSTKKQILMYKKKSIFILSTKTKTNHYLRLLVSVLLSALVERFSVSLMQNFSSLKKYNGSIFKNKNKESKC